MSLVQWSDTKSRSKCRELCRRWWTSSSVKIRAGQLKVKRLCRSENPRPSTSFHHMRPISTLCSLSSDGSFFSLFDCTYHIICWLHCCTSLSHGEWLKGHGVVSMWWRYLQSRVCSSFSASTTAGWTGWKHRGSWCAQGVSRAVGKRSVIVQDLHAYIMIQEICRSEIDLLLSRTLFLRFQHSQPRRSCQSCSAEVTPQECREWKSEHAEATHEEAQIFAWGHPHNSWRSCSDLYPEELDMQAVRERLLEGSSRFNWTGLTSLVLGCSWECWDLQWHDQVTNFTVQNSRPLLQIMITRIAED